MRTTSPSTASLDAFRERADRAGIFLDFDGSLAEIVPRPQQSHPVEGAREALAALVDRYRIVAVVSGRPSDDLIDRLGVDGLAYEGLYGLEDAAPELRLALLPEVEDAAAAVAEAWVENKRVSVAVHYRQAPDPVSARASLVTALQPIASDAGLELVEGKMVLELVPVDRPMKGGAVRRLAGEAGLEAALFAGDDVADLDAFAELDSMAAAGMFAVRVAVQGPETPGELVERADVVVEGPEGLVRLLATLA